MPYQELLSCNYIVDYRFCKSFKSVFKQLITSFLTQKNKICFFHSFKLRLQFLVVVLATWNLKTKTERKGFGKNNRTVILWPQVRTGRWASNRVQSPFRWQLDWSQIELIPLKYVQHKDNGVLVISRLCRSDLLLLPDRVWWIVCKVSRSIL